MASIEKKVNCILWLAELKSTIAVQRKFRIEYNKKPPHRNTIAKWIKNLKRQALFIINHDLEGHASVTKLLHP